MRELRRVLRFGLAGGANTVLTFIAYAALVALGMHYVLANAIAWTLGLLCAFVLGKVFVFRDRRAPIHRSHGQLLGFALVHVLSFALSTALLSLLVENAILGSVRAQFVVIPIVATLNFVCARLLVFTPDTAPHGSCQEHG